MFSLAVQGIHSRDVQRLAPTIPENDAPLGRDLLKQSPRTHYVKCCTTASLSDLRRITLSRGKPGKPRASTHISGLRLEYFSTAPVYVGQWYEELETMAFAPGDRVTGLTFWQTQETPDGAAQIQRENAGRISGVRIERTGSEPTHLEVCLSEKSELLVYSFHENIYEEFVSQLRPSSLLRTANLGP